MRRQQVAETRDRIVAAGAALLHGVPIWNWQALTHRAVAEQAGVTERTVYRYFGSERDLRDGVMERMERDAGIELEGLNFEQVQAIATRILEYAVRFPIAPSAPRDPMVVAANERQRRALVAAVRRAAGGWAPRDRVIAAAMLDVVWSPDAFQRLVTDWELDPKDALRAVRWMIGLIEQALESGPKPGRG